MKLFKLLAIAYSAACITLPVSAMQKAVVVATQQETKTLSAEQQNKLNQELWQAFNKEKLEKSDIDAFYAALEQGADVNAKSNVYRQASSDRIFMMGGKDAERTPIIQAAYWGHVEIVQALLKAGANANAMDSYNKTALHEVVFWNSKDKRLKLIQMLSNALSKAELQNELNKLLRDTITQEEWHARGEMQLALVEELIRLGSDVNAQTYASSLHILDTAVTFRNHCCPDIIIKILIKAGGHFGPWGTMTGSREKPAWLKQIILDEQDLIQNDAVPHLSQAPAKIVSEYLLGEVAFRRSEDDSSDGNSSSDESDDHS